jgi:hypothetical protein
MKMVKVYMMLQVLFVFFLVLHVSAHTCLIVDCQCQGIIALANAIPDMGALSKLDLSMNRLPATETGMLNATCKAKGIDLAL